MTRFVFFVELLDFVYLLVQKLLYYKQFFVKIGPKLDFVYLLVQKLVYYKQLIFKIGANLLYNISDQTKGGAYHSKPRIHHPNYHYNYLMKSYCYTTEHPTVKMTTSFNQDDITSLYIAVSITGTLPTTTTTTK